MFEKFVLCLYSFAFSMSVVALTVLRHFASRERNRPKEASYGFSPTGIFTSLIQRVQEQPRSSILASSHFSALACSSVEQIGDFCNPNPVQIFIEYSGPILIR